MKPSITYLHLLRHTPFFTALSTDQLQWVIDHSREWQAQGGELITSCDDGKAMAKDDWVLLDGGWALEHDGRSFPSGHADPGKWFSADVAEGAACSLVATGNSYVMQIAAADMRDMLAKGFAFDAHLDSGRTYYRAIFNKDAPKAPAGR